MLRDFTLNGRQSLPPHDRVHGRRLPDAVDSSDATHILLEHLPKKNCQAHLDFKSLHTARAYTITENHRQQILAWTEGYPATVGGMM